MGQRVVRINVKKKKEKKSFLSDVGGEERDKEGLRNIGLR